MRTAEPPRTGEPNPSLASVFGGFFWVGISGFGSVLPFAQIMCVERKRWLSEQEFVDAIAMSQFLPGPNVVNLAVTLGGRYQGPLGSLAGVVGLVAAPVVIVLIAAAIVGHFAGNPHMQGALRGMAAVAAGLLLSASIKIARPLFRKREGWGIAVAVAAFIGSAMLRLPLIECLLGLGPLALLINRIRRWRMRTAG